ncbi:hypothetical protein BKA59DRAFT_465171 [Fusarium tricinctum]|uniref:Uncharacterized protein n=1 Tax=Fusarium tricinctum TaxID=61284 RepID=A0A8K0SB07_9HYPO|nr:hypothetical protein BKA59DRAFT_465171 [Fusarium tricinctum]
MPGAEDAADTLMIRREQLLPPSVEYEGFFLLLSVVSLFSTVLRGCFLTSPTNRSNRRPRQECGGAETGIKCSCFSTFAFVWVLGGFFSGVRGRGLEC